MFVCVCVYVVCVEHDLTVRIRVYFVFVFFLCSSYNLSPDLFGQFNMFSYFRTLRRINSERIDLTYDKQIWKSHNTLKLIVMNEAWFTSVRVRNKYVVKFIE